MELKGKTNRQKSSTILQAQRSRSPSSARKPTRGTNGSTTARNRSTTPCGRQKTCSSDLDTDACLCRDERVKLKPNAGVRNQSWRGKIDAENTSSPRKQQKKSDGMKMLHIHWSTTSRVSCIRRVWSQLQNGVSGLCPYDEFMSESPSCSRSASLARS